MHMQASLSAQHTLTQEEPKVEVDLDNVDGDPLMLRIAIRGEGGGLNEALCGPVFW